MQSKYHSFLEAVFNTLIGLAIQYIASYLLLNYYLHIHISTSQNLQMTLIMTVISIARTYFCRRIFNHKTEKHNGKSEAVVS